MYFLLFFYSISFLNFKLVFTWVRGLIAERFTDETFLDDNSPPFDAVGEAIIPVSYLSRNLLLYTYFFSGQSMRMSLCSLILESLTLWRMQIRLF